MDVLYVGSGKSAQKAPEFLRPGLTTCAVNNAWNLFPSGTLNYWIYPCDFPGDRRPPEGYRTKRINHDSYKIAGPASCDLIGTDNKFREHWIGYTIFFQGLHWIMHSLKPSRIFTLGFDHDYNPAKVAKWKEAGCPAPNNRFQGDKPKDVLAWADKFFEGMEPDSFYGQGTPDPLRLGDTEMRTFFQRAQEVADKLNIGLYNLSGVTDGLNTFPQATITDFLA